MEKPTTTSANVIALLIAAAVSTACISNRVSERGRSTDPIAIDRVTAKITSSESCFSGPYGNYESWLSHLRESEPRFNVVALQRRISKDRFDRAKQRLNCQHFRYRVGDVTVEGYSIRQASISETLPVVIYNRGGNASRSRIEFRTLFQRLFDLADEGFFVIASQYRGSGLDGDDIESGEDEFGGKDVDDVMALFDLIDESPYADKDRIGMFGWSRGAIMSFLALTQTNRVSALVVGGAPTDIVEELKVRPEMERVFEARIPDYEHNKKQALERRSVLYWADKLPKTVPILILHGQADNKVSVYNALKLAMELQRQDISYRLVIYEKGRHSLLPNRTEVNNEIAAWFTKKLK